MLRKPSLDVSRASSTRGPFFFRHLRKTSKPFVKRVQENYPDKKSEKDRACYSLTPSKTLGYVRSSQGLERPQFVPEKTLMHTPSASEHLFIPDADKTS